MRLINFACVLFCRILNFLVVFFVVGCRKTGIWLKKWASAILLLSLALGFILGIYAASLLGLMSLWLLSFFFLLNCFQVCSWEEFSVVRHAEGVFWEYSLCCSWRGQSFFHGCFLSFFFLTALSLYFNGHCICVSVYCSFSFLFFLRIVKLCWEDKSNLNWNVLFLNVLESKAKWIWLYIKLNTRAIFSLLNHDTLNFINVINFFYLFIFIFN